MKGVATINYKNPIAIVGAGICEAKLGHDFKGHGGLREGDEDIETKGWTSRPLPPPDGGVQQLEDGICFHEGQILDLIVEE